MKVVWRNDAYRLHAEIYPVEGERGEIIVSRERRYGNTEFDSPTINWSAWGAQPVHIANAYALGLKLAVKIAGEMSHKVRRYEVIFEDLTADSEDRRHTTVILGTNSGQVVETIGAHTDIKVNSILEVN